MVETTARQGFLTELANPTRFLELSGRIVPWLGAAALVGALAAYLGGDFWLQCLMSGVAALLGTFLLRWWRASHPREAAGSNDLDRGQVVLMESWIDRPTGMARVKYRGATWDARIEGEFKDGEVLCIRGQENGVLFVGVNRPHPIAD